MCDAGLHDWDGAAAGSATISPMWTPIPEGYEAREGVLHSSSLSHTDAAARRIEPVHRRHAPTLLGEHPSVWYSEKGPAPSSLPSPRPCTCVDSASGLISAIERPYTSSSFRLPTTQSSA